ncbi:GlxA family transcriptional regulator [Azospirillum formosense]|uniref:GlxA family transcriptional regulator n=1 Tax=Azospirillum formosense TaxID=861533 RepID=UPI001C8FAA83|nr:GlxA family transcriptional regulator [Azospirillum formosense]MBY3757189.1 GlxA family transcriptional regulator [Azospirillum formosense]
MTRHVRFLVHPGFVLLDLGGPLDAFSFANRLCGECYRLSVASVAGGPVRSSCGLAVITDPLPEAGAESGAGGPADTLIVVGAPEPPEGPPVEALAAAIAAAAPHTRRIASVCTGAFILAASGILDGRPATTHWFYAPRLQARYPELRVDGDRIHTCDGGVWTSAGLSAGIDMTLALIEEDLGQEAARSLARMLVVYYRRPGGQYQYSSLLDFDPGSDRIRRTLSFARENLAADLSVERLADVAHLSVRQFGRAFTTSTGMTPAKAVERMRVEAARTMVEDGRQTFAEIARLVGFIDPDRMCQSFLRVLGHSPQELRRQFRQAAR